MLKKRAHRRTTKDIARSSPEARNLIRAVMALNELGVGCRIELPNAAVVIEPTWQDWPAGGEAA